MERMCQLLSIAFLRFGRFLLYVIAKTLLVLVDLSLDSSCFFRSDI